jgi:2-dehydro-3-deoxyphosphogluconate aldolase / (4S)-4-hydroxy-2-oxoglutarate aldolase
MAAVSDHGCRRSGITNGDLALTKELMMNRTEIVKRIENTGIVPIVRAATTELAAAAARAILAAGLDVLEITTSVPNAAGLLRNLREEVGDKVVLGAGTVLNPQAARECIAAGAEFIVAPGFDLETVRAAHALDRPCMPGALTPTEVIMAWNAGADMVKVFPCSAVGGAAYLKALKAPLPHIKMLPTGGVDVSTAADFIKAGAAALGVGASVIDLEALVEGRCDSVTERFRQLCLVVKSARGL